MRIASMHIFSKMKIRTRLALYFTATVAVILFSFSLGISHFAKVNRYDRFSRKLKNRALTDARLLFLVRDIDEGLLKQIDNYTINELFDEEIAFYNEKNVCIYKNYDHISKLLSPSEFKLIQKQGEYLRRDSNRDLIGVLFPYAGKTYTVVVRAYDRYGYLYLSNLEFIIWGGLLASLLITMITSYFFAQKALKPIKDVITQARKISVNRLNLRLNEGNGDDELALLAITFNRMLNRIENAFVTQKIFLSSASHELRTPITAIQGEIEVALFKERTNEEYIRVLKTVLSETKAMAKLTNDLLELSQTSVDFADTRQTDVRIDEVLLAAQNEAVQKHPTANIKVDFEEFPEDQDQLTIRGNDNLLRIAFRNLMDNASKFSDFKLVEVKIGFHLKQVQVCVLDHGIGIKACDKERVFDEFYRAPNAQSFKGQGIGLSMVRKIIEMHKGSIQLDSVEGKGTTFAVLLPHITAATKVCVKK